MNHSRWNRGAVARGLALLAAGAAGSTFGADWPQWRGPNRDGRVSDFKAPEAWPKELKQQWKATVGTGDATPALVGDRVYAFARQNADEVILCLGAADGKVIWQDKYPTVTVNGAASGHPGPRSSPAVADGKVVTFGVGGVLSCLDADSGKVLWRKDTAKDFSPAYPQFYTASSPLIVDGTCVVQVGGQGKGAVVAFDLNAGEKKWAWDGEAPTYSSPVVMTADGVKQVVAIGERSVVGLASADGKLLWQVPLQGQGGPGGGGPGAGPGGGGPGGPGGGGPGGGGRPRGPGGGGGRGMGGQSYNATTPVIDGESVIISGQGVRAFKIEKQGDSFAAKEAWANADISTPFNTPVLRDGMLYGLTGSNSIFCLDAKTGKTIWPNNPAGGNAPGGGGPGGPGRPGGGRGMRGGGMRGGFGSIVDAGSVLLSLTPGGDLTVFKPGEKELSEVAKIKLPDSSTYAYPVLAGNRILIKGEDAVMAFSLE